MATVEDRVTALERSMATKDDIAGLDRKAEERHAEHERKAEERHKAVMDATVNRGRSPMN